MYSAPIALIRFMSLPIGSMVPVIGILCGLDGEFEEDFNKLGYVNTTIRISDGFLFAFLAVSRKVFIVCSCCSNGTILQSASNRQHSLQFEGTSLDCMPQVVRGGEVSALV